MVHGYEIRKPSGHCSWDFEVVVSDRIVRIQVKSGYWNRGYWVHCLSKSGEKQPYQRQDFDYLALDGPDGDLYLIPSPDLHASNKNKDKLPTGMSSVHKNYQMYKINAPN